ncbi:MAG: hypothetical protein AAF721_16700 [Myxococcota bacterium]
MNNALLLVRVSGLVTVAAMGAGCPTDAVSVAADGSTSAEDTAGDPPPELTSSPSTTSTTSTTSATSADEPGGGTGCCDAHPTAGCDIESVQACVCELSASCCAFEWDDVCAAHAVNDCGGCDVSDDTAGVGSGDTTTTDDSGGGGLGGDCCEIAPTSGCNDVAVEMCVCDQDEFCCAMQWDDLCVELAAGCGAACELPEPTCCDPQRAGGCVDTEISDCTCLLDPACCDTAWSPACVALSVAECTNLCEGIDFQGEGDCCEPHATAGCEANDVQICACAADEFCCAREWDEACVEGAVEVCALECPGAEGGESGETDSGTGDGALGGTTAELSSSTG